MLQRLFAVTIAAAFLGALVSACGGAAQVPTQTLGAVRLATSFPNLGIGNGDWQQTIYLYGYSTNQCPWSVSPTPVPFIPPRSAGGYYLTHNAACAPSKLANWTIFFGLKPRNSATTCALDVAYSSGKLVYSVANGSDTDCYTEPKSNQQIFAWCPGGDQHCFAKAQAKPRLSTVGYARKY